MFEDKSLICEECGQEFIFTSGEQEFYHQKGFENQPKRCKDCRTQRRNSRSSKSREMFTAICAKCGTETQVPFRPVEDRPVYCLQCFQEQRQAAL